MTSRMIELASNADTPVEEIGRLFFADRTTQSERKALLAFLLGQQRFEQLCALFACANLNARSAGATVAAVTGEGASLESRYFYLFADCARSCGIDEESIVQAAFAALRAKKTSGLRGWSDAARAYVKRLAYDDYERAASYFYRYDPDFRHADILIEVDRNKTLALLLDMAVLGKGVQKTALRGFLRGYNVEVYSYVRSIYATLKTDERVAAVRLLLPLKNDASVSELLGEIEREEKAASVLRLLRAGGTATAEPENFTPEQATSFLYDAMVEGKAFSREFFMRTLLFPPFTASENLFFSVYRGKMLTNIVIVDGGKVLDLQNEPIELASDCTVRVLHPTELTAKTDYIKRLNITQPFEQIRRPVFLPSDEDRRAGGCMSVSGTVEKVREFDKNRRKTGFKALSRDADGLCRQVGLAREGVLCVVALSPIDWKHAPLDSFVQAQSVRFYDEEKVVKFGGKRFTDGVPPLSVSALPLRVFSEFMVSVHELMGLHA